METKAKLPKKLLSMFLAVLMAFSCFSLVMPELVPQANAAVDKTTVVNLINQAVNGAEITAASGNSWSFTVDHKSEYAVLLAARAIYDYAVNTVGKASKSSTKLYEDTVSSLNVSGEGATLVKNVLDPGSSTITKGNASYTKDGKIEHGTSKSNYVNNQDVSNDSNVSYAGSALSAVTKSAKITVDRNKYILTLSGTSELPTDLIESYSVSITNTAYNKAVITSANYEDGKSGCDQKYSSNWTSYRYHEITLINGTDGNVKNVYADFEEYINYFTAERLATKAEDLLDKSVAELNTLYDATTEKYDSLVDTYGETVASQFFDFEAITDYLNEVTFATQVVNAQPNMKIMLDLIDASYDKNDINEMNTVYAQATAAYNVIKGYTDKIFEFVIKNYKGFEEFSKAAAAKFVDDLDYDIQYFNLSKFKDDVDDTIAANNPKLADPLNRDDITNEELSAIIGQIKGYQNTIATYTAPGVVNAVFTEGTDYIFVTYRDATQTKLNSRDVQANYDVFWEYFYPLIYNANIAKWSMEELTTRYNEDTKKQSALNFTYGENVNSIGKELAEKVYTIKYTIGDVEENLLTTAVADYISRLKTTIKDTNNAQLDNIEQYVVYNEDGTISGEVNFGNFVGLKSSIGEFNETFYKFADSISLVDKSYQALYSNLGTLLTNYDKFVDSGGLDENFEQNHYHNDDGIYTTRPGGGEDYPNDIARKDGEDYVVNVDKVNDTITKLDGFITSKDFGEIIGIKNANDEITDLPAYIEELLTGTIFTNDTVNMLAGAILPMLATELEGMLMGLFAPDETGKSPLGDMGVTPTRGGLAGIDVQKAVNPDGSNILLRGISGTLDIFMDEVKFNGTQYQNDLPTAFAELGIAIYPSTFADSLYALDSVKYSKTSDIYTRLKAAGRDWSKLVVADNPETEDVDETVALDFDWGVEDYNTFISAIGAVFNSLLPVLQTALCGHKFEATAKNAAYIAGNIKVVILGNNDIGAYGDLTLTIEPLTLFRDVLGLVFETLGVTDDGFTITVPGPDAKADVIAKAIFDPLLELINQLKAAPITKVMEILPSLMYFLSMDKISDIIGSIKLDIGYSVSADINGSESDWLAKIIDWLEDKGVTDFLSGIVSDTLPLDVAELLKPEGAESFNIADLIGFDITNINAVISFVLGMIGLEGVSLPIINAGEVIQTSSYKQLNDSITTGGTRNRFYADKADVFYFLLDYIVSALGNKKFVEGLFDFIAYSSAEKTIDSDGDGEPDTPTEEAVAEKQLDENISELLMSIVATVAANPENALAALVELFQPQHYKTETIDWVKSQYNYGGITGMNAASLMYLDYGNDWTKQKATYLINNIDAIVSSVLTMAGQEEAAVNTLIQDMFDELFSNINVTGLVKAVSSLGTALGDTDIIYTMLKGIGADFKVLYDAFGYMFVTDLDRIGDGFTEPLKPGDEGYVNNFKFQVVEYEHEIQYKTDDKGEYVLDDNGEKIVLYEQKLLVDADGNKILGADGKEQYVDIYVRLDEEGKLVECEATDEGARRIPQTKVVASWAYDYGDGNIKYINDESTDPDVIKETKTIFVDIICDILAGFSKLLGAFFRGDSVGIFNNSIEILGYENYADTLGLFFELLGIPGAMTQAQYEAYCDAHGDTGALSYTIQQIFNWVDGYLLTGNTVQKIIEIIPNFIYFVESNGLSVLLHNLLMPVLVLVDTIRPIIDLNLNGLVSFIVSELLNGKEFALDGILAYLGGSMAATVDEEYKYLNIDLGHLTITEIVKIADTILGTNLAGSPLGRYGLPGFCSGVVKTENSVVTGGTYRSTVDAPDTITILLSALLEAVQYPSQTDEKGNVIATSATNGEVICEFIQEMMGESEEGEEAMDIKAIYTAVIGLIQGVDVTYTTPDWGYMFENPDDFSITLPAHSIAYLDYSTDWTEDKAKAVEKNLDAVIKMVLTSATKDEEATIAKLLYGLFNDKVFTDENLTMIVEGIVNLIAGLDEVLRNTIDVVIDTDIASWFEMCDLVTETDEDGNAKLDEDGNEIKKYKVKATKNWGVNDAEEQDDKIAMFAAGLGEALMPAERLIAWFLFGEDFAFFTGTEKDKDGKYTYDDIITLSGGRAYDFALVPILEALGLTMPVADTFYMTDPITGEAGYNVSVALDTIINSVLTLVNEISANPTKGVLDLLVNLLYFINADGLKSSVNNLLAPIDGLLAKFAHMIPDLNGATSIAAILKEKVTALNSIDISNLSMEGILGIVASMTGATMSTEMRNILLNFYVGKLEYFTSANGNDAYRMVYTDDECYHDMLTIVLAFALDLFKQNRDLFSGLLDNENPGLYDSIIKILAGVEAQIRETDWGYMYEGEKLADRTATLVESGFPATTITYLEYTRDWTTETATAAYNALDNILDMVLPTVLEGKANLKELVTNLLNDEVFTDANLEAIVQLIVDALMTFDAELYNAVGALVDADISTWFETMCEEVPLRDEEGNTTLDENNEMVMTYVVKKGYFGVAEAEDKQAKFVDGLKAVLAPASELLNWLLFGGKYEFLRDTEGNVLITLNGGEGYKYGLAPILEALGCENLAANNIVDGIGVLVNSVVGLLTNLENSESTVAFALNLIPNLLYFINAGGLKASVSNLVAPVNAVLAELSTVLDGKDNLGALLEDVIHINIEELDLDSLLGLIPEDVTFNMTDGMKEALEHIYVVDNDDTAESFTSVSGKTAYKITADGGKTLTVILSFALEAFKENEALFSDLLDKVEPGLYDSVINILNGVTSEAKDIDWAYMYGTDAGKTQFYTEPKFPATKITYLESTRDWTAATATAAYNALDNILDMVLPAVLEDNQTLLTLVTNLLNDEVFTDENLEAIVELIVNALAGFDADLYKAVGALVDGNIGTWFDDMCEEIKDADGNVTGYKVIEGQFKVADATDKQKAFVDGLKAVLAPASELLNWLFFGGEYTFFNGTDGKALLTLKGGNGYALGLAPILEALGCENLAANNIVDGIGVLVNSVVGLLTNLENSESTVAFALNLIPNLLYFINAGGLKASVSNLVAPINAVLAELSAVLDGKDNLGELLAGVLNGLNIEELDLDSLLGLIPADVNFEMTTAMEEALEHIYVVDNDDTAESFTSVSGKTAYEITADGGKTLTVILSFALEAFKKNDALFSDLLGADVYTAVKTLLAGVEATLFDIDWAYMYATDAEKQQFYAEPKFPATKLQYLAYTTDWTEDTAVAVYNALDNILDMVLPGLLNGKANLKELVENLLNGSLYTDANLEAIVELIVNLLADFDADLYNAVGALVDADISTWFEMCDLKPVVDEEGVIVAGKTEWVVKENYFKVDEATDKKAAFVAGLKEVLAPAEGLLAWLFLGRDFTFLNGTTNDPLITIKGGQGYELGLVPILEALGCEMKPAAETVGKTVENIIESVLALLENLTSSASTVEFAFNLIPNLLYFINAGGLKASVNNLVAPVDAVIATLSGLIGEESLAALLTDVIGIDISNLTTDALLGILKSELGFKMNGAMEGTIRRIFALGKAEAFTSANGKTAYKLVAEPADTLTVLLSFALDAFNLNDALFTDLLGAEIYTSVKTLIKGVNGIISDIDWGYMYDGETVADRTAALKAAGKFAPVSDFQYLKYATNWTADTADKVYEALDDILVLVLPSLLGENENLKTLVEGILNKNVYTTENLEAIVELIVNALAGFDADLYNAVGALVDADISTWFSMCAKNAEGKYEVKPGTFNVTDKASFVAGLKAVLQPANELLSWLFFGTEFTFFNGTTNNPLITINGGKGYAYGLVPILEALGVTGLKKALDYKGADGKYDVGAAVADILDRVLALLDKLVAADSTVEFAFTLIPNLLYFINADGIKTSVNNLVAPVDAVIATLSGVIGEDSLADLLADVLTDSIGIDIFDLNTDTLLGLLETKLGFVMNPDMKQAVKDIHAVGTPAVFTSASGKTAYKLNADKGDTLTVILSFALDAFNLNKALFADLLGEAQYDAVHDLILGASEGFAYTEIDWGYMFEGADLDAKLDAIAKAEGKLPNYPKNSTAANYLLYGNNWNDETAVYVDMILDKMIAGFMSSTSLGQMLDNAVSKGLYTDDIVNSLIAMVVELIVDYAGIIEGAGALLGAESIVDWFDYCEITKDADGKVISVEANHDWGIDKAKTNDEKREKFVEAFVTVLKPAYRLLAWLLFDQEFTFFNGTTNEVLITLTGGRGYEEGLVPLLEALGCVMPEDYDAPIVMPGDPNYCYANGQSGIKPASAYVTTDKDGKVTAVNMEAAVRDVFTALTDWLYMICGDLAAQETYGIVGTMLELLPNVIYNINAGTLKAVVSNLLVPVEEILGHLKAFGLEVDFNTIIDGIPLKSIGWYEIFDIVADLVGLYWPPEIEEFLATLYVGKAVEFTSANGKTAYFTTYNENDKGSHLISGREDMITLLVSFVVDGVLDERNAPRLKGWFGDDIYNVIMTYLTKNVEEVEMKDFDWILTEYANTGKVLSPITLGGVDALYGELYTREMGEYINTYLPSFIDTMIVLLGVESENGVNYEGLEDILNELIGDTLYTKANLQAILDAIAGLIPTIKDELGADLFDIIVNVLDKALNIDLTHFETYKIADFKDGDRDAFVTGLVEMLEPIYPILAWLLTDEDLIALFHTADGSDAVVIEGAEGYAYGIVPLLEAFDYDSKLILDPDAYKAASKNDPELLLRNILNPILNVVDQVLADPVNEIFNVLPALIYFINSNGLDAVIRNTLNAVVTVLHSIEPLTDGLTVEKIYEMIGFNGKIDIVSLLESLLRGIEEDTGFQFTEVAMNAITDLTVGKVVSFKTKNGFRFYNDKPDYMSYTMEYAPDGDRVDMVTVVLRAVLTFISVPQNVKALEGILEGQLNDEGYKFLCSLLENFSQMAAKDGGMDEIMYTVYQIFYAANVAAHSTEDWLAEFNGDYSFLNQLFATSDLAFLRQLESSLGDLLNKYTGDIVDDDEVVPNGFIAFFQKIADFFKKIGEFFKNLFK